jgi:hypothetical protein
LIGRARDLLSACAHAEPGEDTMSMRPVLVPILLHELPDRVHR